MIRITIARDSSIELIVSVEEELKKNRWHTKRDEQITVLIEMDEKETNIY